MQFYLRTDQLGVLCDPRCGEEFYRRRNQSNITLIYISISDLDFAEMPQKHLSQIENY